MQQATDAPPRRPRLRLPRPRASEVAEYVLLALIAVQCARLFWALVTPMGPVGDWRAAEPRVAAAGPLGAGDAFFRSSGQAGPAVVTALDLKLYGVREDRATGRGSAIVQTPDGRQASFAVGDEIMPGVTLASVGFDHVTIRRNGAEEQIFLDQSGAADPAAPATPAAGPVTVGPGTAAPSPTPAGAAQIQMTPRTVNGRVTGIAVAPAGSGDAFRAAGFAPGDVILSVNGQLIASAEQARALVAEARGEVSLVVDRGGRRVPMRVRLNP